MRLLASAKIRGAAPRGVAQRGESKRAYPATVIGPPGRPGGIDRPATISTSSASR
jgi:hypothetical protein